MSYRKNFGRKQIGDKSYLLKDLETLSAVKKIDIIDYSTKIVTNEKYTVTNENLLLVKTEGSATIILDENSSEIVTIKSLTNTTIKTNDSKIDEYYDEITIGKGACVEIQKIQGNWYVLSSDGIKLD